MQEKIENSDNEIKLRSDTLLVHNLHNNKIEMVQGVDKEGNLPTFPPEEKKENNKLIRVDKHGDIFSNFYSQLKNPTRFNSFKVSEYDALKTAKDLQQYVNQASPEEKEKLKDYHVSTKNTNPLKHKNAM